MGQQSHSPPLVVRAQVNVWLPFRLRSIAAVMTLFQREKWSDSLPNPRQFSKTHGQTVNSSCSTSGCRRPKWVTGLAVGSGEKRVGMKPLAGEQVGNVIQTGAVTVGVSAQRGQGVFVAEAGVFQKDAHCDPHLHPLIG